MTSEQRKRNEAERKRKYQNSHPESRKKCDICGNTSSPHLHCIKSLSESNFELLRQVSGKSSLSHSHRVCCDHFEFHQERNFKASRLRVRKEFATSYYTSPAKRRKTDRQFVFPLSKTRVEEDVEVSLVPIQSEEVPLPEVIECIDLKLLQQKVELLEKSLAEKEVEIKAKEEKIEELQRKCSELQSSKNIWYLIGPPHEHSRFWIGVSTPGILFEQWRPFIQVRQWETDKLATYCLFWLKHGFPFSMLQGFLQKEKCNLRKLFMKVIHSIVPWAKEQLKFPSVDTWISSTPDEMKAAFPSVLFFFVDGTVLRIKMPMDEKTARATFNSKHGYHGYVFFIVVMPNGKIAFVSGIRDGSTHDKSHWNQSGAVESLKQAYPVRTEGYSYAIGGDKAYPGLQRPDGWKSYVTMTAEEVEGGIRDQVHFFRDAGIARFRAVVERAIGAVKKWRLLENEAFLTKVRVKELEEILLVICALTNYQLNDHGGTW